MFVNCHHLGASTRSFVRPSLHGSRTSPLHRPTCVVGLSRVFCKFRTRRPGHVIAERKSRGFSGEWRFQFKWHAKGWERIKKKKNYAEKRREEWERREVMSVEKSLRGRFGAISSESFCVRFASRKHHGKSQWKDLLKFPTKPKQCLMIEKKNTKKIHVNRLICSTFQLYEQFLVFTRIFRFIS